LKIISYYTTLIMMLHNNLIVLSKYKIFIEFNGKKIEMYKIM